MYKSIFLIFFILSYSYSNGQSDKIREIIVTNFKLRILIDDPNQLKSKEQINSFFENEHSSSYKILSSNFNPSWLFLSYDRDFGYGSCEYIIAVKKEGGRLYKLKGFIENDFKELACELLRNNGKITKKKVRKLFRNIKVKGLDFNCLIGNMNKNKNCHEPCLHIGL